MHPKRVRTLRHSRLGVSLHTQSWIDSDDESTMQTYDREHQWCSLRIVRWYCTVCFVADDFMTGRFMISNT